MKYVKGEIVEENDLNDDTRQRQVVIDVEYIEIGVKYTPDDTMKKDEPLSSKTKFSEPLSSVPLTSVPRHNLEKYKQTYNIRDLFSAEVIKQVAEKSDVDAIFSRDFSNFSTDRAHINLGLLKEKCFLLVDGVNTIEQIVFYYAPRYRQILNKG